MTTNTHTLFIELTHQTRMKKVHDNVHKRYSDKKGTFIGTGGTLG